MLVNNISFVPHRSARTRALLQESALDLASRQGFEATTVAQIAAAAGVTPMTFFRHFATKEDVVLDDPYDPVLAEAVRMQPVALPAVERVRQAVVQTWAALPEPVDATTRARVALMSSTPSLMARAWQNNRRTEQGVADALVATGVERLEADVASGAVFGALTAALLGWGSDGGRGPLGERIVEAMRLLDPAVGGQR
jgi:AcrR family transcriptional regulator